MNQKLFCGIIMIAFAVMAAPVLSCLGLVAWLSDFILYGSQVPILRKILVGFGVSVIAIAIAYRLAARRLNKRVIIVVSDAEALPLFLVAMILVPMLCFGLSAATRCDFLDFQGGASLTLFIEGSIVAVRVKKWRYVFYYFALLLLLGGLVPPT